MDLPALEDLELPMCEDCHVEMKVIDLRIGVREGYAEGYGIALIECPSCLAQEENKVALLEDILLAAGRRFDHRRNSVEEFGFIATFEPKESDRPRRPVHRPRPPKELVLGAV